MKRIIKAHELRLLEFLIKNAGLGSTVHQNLHSLLVEPMSDGEMGSLLLYPNGDITEKRAYGRRASEFQFTDIDGVEVLASLNLDDKGLLFELDIWKTDFSKLKMLPQDF